MVYQIIACNKDGQSEKQQYNTVVNQVLLDGRKSLGEFIQISDDSVSASLLLILFRSTKNNLRWVLWTS